MGYNLFLIRGLSGSGKTTTAVSLAGNTGEMFSADDFFEDGDQYKFDKNLLGQAHKYCQQNVADAMEADVRCIIVHNTFSTRWELQPYIELADKNNYRLTVLSLFDGGMSSEELAARNSHNVPAEVIDRMRDRFEHNWRDGDPNPPWKR